MGSQRHMQSKYSVTRLLHQAPYKSFFENSSQLIITNVIITDFNFCWQQKLHRGIIPGFLKIKLYQNASIHSVISAKILIIYIIYTSKRQVSKQQHEGNKGFLERRLICRWRLYMCKINLEHIMVSKSKEYSKKTMEKNQSRHNS